MNSENDQKLSLKQARNRVCCGHAAFIHFVDHKYRGRHTYVPMPNGDLDCYFNGIRLCHICPFPKDNEHLCFTITNE